MSKSHPHKSSGKDINVEIFREFLSAHGFMGTGITEENFVYKHTEKELYIKVPKGFMLSQKQVISLAKKQNYQLNNLKSMSNI